MLYPTQAALQRHHGGPRVDKLCWLSYRVALCSEDNPSCVPKIPKSGTSPLPVLHPAPGLCLSISTSFMPVWALNPHCNRNLGKERLQEEWECHREKWQPFRD